MKNITYINAGAGSGKTYRLTEEMVSKVKNGLCTPSQIIASTFTNEAAADLKKNAREKFLANGLFAEAAELDSATIGTVHAIGFQYIRKYWYKLGLSASVETVTDEVKMGYLNRTMTKVVSDGDIAAFRMYAETFGLKKQNSTKINDEFWKSMVKDLVEKADAFGIRDLSVSEGKSVELAQLLLGGNGRFAFLNNPEKSENELRDMYYDCIHRIFRIARDWYILFDQFKEEHGLIEFNDMENKFIQLLGDDEVRSEIAQTVKYVFVDEFQDSNPKQIKIFDLLSDLVERSFWVGDPKQAIYGFRGCDTELVQALTNKIIQSKKNGADDMDYETLSESRRSVAPLVNTTSEVFTHVFDDLEPERIVLSPYRNETLPDNAPALWHWEQMKTLTPGNKKTSVSKEKLSNSIAKQIRDMVDGRGEIKYVIDKETGKSRSVKWSDIAVLARSNNDVDAISSALKAKDIPVVGAYNVQCNCKELRLVRLLLNYMTDESPLLKAEIAHLLYGVQTKSIFEDKRRVLTMAEFGKLDALKERLKTLPVSDIVKTLVIELDLINLCHKWGRAEQRERNLQALIEDAKVFDENAMTLGEASSIEQYLTHLDEEGVTVGEGFFKEGVHVLTYHRSKGLQWHVVVLCSLEDDVMSEKKLMKRFAIGVNYVRENQPDATQLYSDYYITCLPAFLSSAASNLMDDMMNDIRGLDAYNQYYERVKYELRRLLYVGVTRARDYLITTSLEGKKMPWLQESGIESDMTDNGGNCVVWGEWENVSESRLVKIADDDSYKGKSEPENYSCRKEMPVSSLLDEKYLSPSKMEDVSLTEEVEASVLYPIQDDVPRPVCVGPGDEYDIMGTAIHNVFAIYRPEADAAEMRDKAKKIIDAYGMGTMLPDVDGIIRSIAGLYECLEKQFGKAVRVEHEVTFRHEKDGQIVVGEMDLLWFTSQNECVLVDFKNYPGIMSKALNKTDKEYVGRYAPQLSAYEAALTKAGLTVKAKLVYYSVLGYLVKM